MVELVAYDEAGNMGFATKYLVTVNPGNLKINIEKFEWQSYLMESIVSIVTASFSQYIAKNVFLSVYKGSPMISEYTAQVLEWG